MCVCVWSSWKWRGGEGGGGGDEVKEPLLWKKKAFLFLHTCVRHWPPQGTLQKGTKQLVFFLRPMVPVDAFGTLAIGRST